MLRQRVGILLGDRLGEVAAELATEIGIIRHVRFEQLVAEGKLGIGKQHGELRPRQRLRAAAPFGDFLVIGQELDAAVELARGFQRLHQSLLEAQVLEPAPFGEREGERLLIVVAQHQGCDLIGQLGQELIARGERELALAHRRGERDLDVDLDVGSVDSGGVVNRIGVEPHATRRRLDAAALGHAEVGTLAHHLGAQVGTGDADRIVGAVADRVVGLGRGTHIGADAAEEKEIDRRLEDRAHHLLRRGLGLVEPDRSLRLVRERDFLGAAREHAAAGRDQCLVIVLPARAR